MFDGINEADKCNRGIVSDRRIAHYRCMLINTLYVLHESIFLWRYFYVRKQMLARKLCVA